MLCSSGFFIQVIFYFSYNDKLILKINLKKYYFKVFSRFFLNNVIIRISNTFKFYFKDGIKVAELKKKNHPWLSFSKREMNIIRIKFWNIFLWWKIEIEPKTGERVKRMFWFWILRWAKFTRWRMCFQKNKFF